MNNNENKSIDKLPDLSSFPTFEGLHYCDEVTELPNGHKSMNWQKFELFTDDEVQKISDAAAVLERFFDNVNRLEDAKAAFREFKSELESLNSNDSFAIATVDRRFRAYIFEWKLFIDHWKKYIDDGAQTRHWKDKSNAEKYIKAYQRLYKDITSEVYDSCEEYVLATAIRNHVVHANNAVYSSKIAPGDNKVFISRDELLAEIKVSTSQENIIRKQDKLIDLAVVAEKSLKAAEQVMEELLNFQIDDESSKAALVLLKANNKIVGAGIESDRWMIFHTAVVRWEPSFIQPASMQRVKNGEENSVQGSATSLPVMVPTMGVIPQYLNWKGYIAFSVLLSQLYESGKWQTLQKKYLGEE